jgi:Na+-translocating ferredoxin:NAD+ oxidoreductase subunit E
MSGKFMEGQTTQYRLFSSQRWREGVWDRNPALVMLLGLCPLLAVSNSTVNGVALALATMITLCVSNGVVAALRHQLVTTVRIPMTVLIIAGTVTIIEQLLLAYATPIHRSLGLFLPLIVTNCLILGRAEVYARHHGVTDALIDALIMGVGFGIVLIVLGALREWLGGALLIALLPPGAFILVGLLLALKNAVDQYVLAPPEQPPVTSSSSSSSSASPSPVPNAQPPKD